MRHMQIRYWKAAYVSWDLTEYETAPYAHHKIMQMSDSKQGMYVEGICITTLKSALCPHTRYNFVDFGEG